MVIGGEIISSSSVSIQLVSALSQCVENIMGQYIKTTDTKSKMVTH